MTVDKIKETLDIIAGRSPYPIKSFELRDWDHSGELQVSVTFQVAEPKWATTVAQEADKS